MDNRLKIEVDKVVSLTEAMERFAEVCRQVAANIRGVTRYLHQGKYLHRPIQRLDKKRRRHG